MFVAQVSSDAGVVSTSGMLLITILLPTILLAFVVLVVIISLRYARFAREKLHAERLKMIEAGFPVDEPEQTKRQQQFMHNAFWISFWLVAFVPLVAFSAAATASDYSELAGFVIAIWIAASIASVAAVVSAAVLMIFSRSKREDDSEARPPIKNSKPGL